MEFEFFQLDEKTIEEVAGHDPDVAAGSLGVRALGREFVVHIRGDMSMSIEQLHGSDASQRELQEVLDAVVARLNADFEGLTRMNFGDEEEDNW